MIKNLKDILIILIIIVGGFFSYKFFFDPKIVEETVIEEKWDTVKVTDTIFEPKPYPVKVTEVRWDTLTVNDTILIPLIIEQKHYNKEGFYDVWVSGYDVNMDSIKTYNNKEYIYVDRTIEVVKEKTLWERFNLNVTMGPGINLTNGEGGIMGVIGLGFDLIK